MNEWKPNSLSVIYSNLKKAAEKQQKNDLVEQYANLAQNLRQKEIFPGDLATLRDLIADDITETIPKANELATSLKDRGAMRALKWSNSVSRIQKSLIERFLKKGEEPFEGKSFYVCEACGFIYLGEDEPNLCPACKAPSSRFILIK